MPCEQYGFRRGHSTTDQILFFCQTIRDAHNFKPTHHTVAALLDLTKAFAGVWKHKLILKLHDSFEFRGKTLSWISDFLQRRFIKVKFNKSLSDTFELSQGDPQCSVLSSTLFSMYVAGIDKVPSSGIKIGMFADDIVLWSSGIAIPDLESKLNDSLTALSKFAAGLKLHFNPSKTIAICFSTNKHLYNYQPKLRPIRILLLKSRKRLDILKYIASKNRGADATTLRFSYLRLNRPILEYGFPIHCCASNSVLKKLDQVQLSAARIMTGLKHSCPSNIVLFEADVQPLLFRRQTGYFNKLSSFGHQSQTPKYLNNWISSLNFERNDSQWGQGLTSTVGDGEFPTSTAVALTRSFVRHVVERYRAGELELSVWLFNHKISHHFV
ncbi:putative RNA-directed DNA polymerase from transposon BS [Nephila pilipes]|uniref:Putative RNA-directed DNA polymerase from transposon BS n=1 Tax=Nephila pilipes TaxID=299642 RepID=A0A8X6URG1_NEPPI|nr:putative RNA-directed DNA polymerase from transposon BS [Nephila pilipes]